jgi:hypothetical protein
MTASIINLRARRKARARAEKAARAAQARALHGRSKAERQRDEALAHISRRAIDGARREPGDDSDGQDSR